ncbi:hypothetical protein J0656_19640 [Muricauda ruestringensis]|uniref:DUF1653 domain-containing protein n=1 Tax=Flagellimonas aurea TaxID=2915619 RepID=A0ABS3G9Y9_9FLAO|nr:hypothetical protein [Allomuricauda aurea]MBO0356240.1 hypothetical protein [Allomuricauda aurea]
MGKRKKKYPEITRGQFFKVDGEFYEIIDIKVISVESPTKFMTMLYFRSKDTDSEKPFFSEQVETVLSDPAFERAVIWNHAKLREWCQQVPGGVSTRLQNVLWRICNEEDEISPFMLTKEEFLAIENAGEKTWKEFERVKRLCPEASVK